MRMRFAEVYLAIGGNWTVSLTPDETVERTDYDRLLVVSLRVTMSTICDNYVRSSMNK